MVQQTQQYYEFGPFCIDANKRLLMRDGKRVPLTSKAFEILMMLVESGGRVVEKEDLLKRVWPDSFVEEGNLTYNISLLRKALGERAADHKYIVTMPGRGYRFVAMVQEVRNGGTASIEWGRSDTATEDPEVTASAREATPVMHQRRRSHGWWAIPTGTGVILIGTLVFWLRAPMPQPKILSSTQITNDSRQKAWDYAPPGFFALVTDGSRVFFSELTKGPWSIAQVPASGGETVTIQTPFEKVILFDVSADGSWLLAGTFSTLETEAPIWVVPSTGGSPYRLGDLLAHDAAWSPDGSMVVYANGSDLYLAQADGTRSRKLVAVDGRPSWIRWSPDSSRLRFTLHDASTNSSSLWEVSADGTDLHKLLEGWKGSLSACCGNWTADGKYYVFQSSLDSASNIWAVPEKRGLLEKRGPDPVQLTIGPMNFSRPVPSRDGRKLFALGELQRGELVRYDTKSGQFVSYLSGMSAEHLDFSRDGEWVAYVTHPDGTLYRSRLDGSRRVQLSLPQMVTALPRWSPDGGKIAFMTRAPGGHWKIYLVSSEGGAPKQLIEGEINEGDPTWSPDGNRLAFGSNSDGFDKTPLSPKILLLDIGTGRVSKLPGSEGKFSPRWSPDGRHMVAQSADMKELLLFDFTVGRWVVLARAELTNGIIIGWPHWSQDSKYIYFLSWGGNSAIYRIRVSDYKLERMASLKDMRLSLGVFGGWVGYAPDDSPVVLRHIGSQEIYALEWMAP